MHIGFIWLHSDRQKNSIAFRASRYLMMVVVSRSLKPPPPRLSKSEADQLKWQPTLAKSWDASDKARALSALARVVLLLKRWIRDNGVIKDDSSSGLGSRHHVRRLIDPRFRHPKTDQYPIAFTIVGSDPPPPPSPHGFCSQSLHGLANQATIDEVTYEDQS